MWGQAAGNAMTAARRSADASRCLGRISDVDDFGSKNIVDKEPPIMELKGGGARLGDLQDAISLPKSHQPSTLDPKPKQQPTKNHLKFRQVESWLSPRVRIVEAPQIGGGSWLCASTAHAGGSIESTFRGSWTSETPRFSETPT